MSNDNSVSPYLPPADMPSFVPADPGAAPIPPDAPAVPMAAYPTMPAPDPGPYQGSPYGLPPVAPMPQFPQPYGAVPAYPVQAQPTYPYQASPYTKNHFGVMALIFGIITILDLGELGSGTLSVSWATDPGTAAGTLLFVLAFPVLALVMGITGIRAFGRRQANNRGMSIAGVVMGGIFFAVLLAGVFAVLSS